MATFTLLGTLFATGYAVEDSGGWQVAGILAA